MAVKQETLEAVTKKLVASLKTLEEELGDKPYFWEETFEFMDVGLICLYSLFYTYKSLRNFSIQIEYPNIVGTKRYLQRDIFELRTKFAY